MEEKSILIIGAGMAGLSAGCYGRMNGYRTRIFEMHNQPGGLCTSWKRQGYTIDGCIHWLVGSGPSLNFYRIWEELGAVQGREMVNHEEYLRIERANGQTLIIYTDLDRLERHLKELAPEDQMVIEEVIEGARFFTRHELPIEKAPELYGLLDGLKMLPVLGAMKKWGRMSIQDFATRFKNPLLRDGFPLFFTPGCPMVFLLLTLAWLHQKSAGYPLGGSLEFARAIERRYLDLGGEIHYRARVARILVEEDRAVGIRLEDGSEHRGDYVISAADGHATIFDMLEGKYADDKIRGYYENLPPFPPLIHVALGVNRTFEELPPSAGGLYWQLAEPVRIADQERDWLGVHVYNFDPTLAPPGKTVMNVLLLSDYDYWKTLSEDPGRYAAEKEQIADQVVALLDQRFPGLAEQVEMRDVATPLTFERYTGNWRGSFEGWLLTPESWSLRMSKTLPGLENFYMAGQWVEPGGGLPPAAFSGRNVMQLLCQKDGKPFVTTVP